MRKLHKTLETKTHLILGQPRNQLLLEIHDMKTLNYFKHYCNYLYNQMLQRPLKYGTCG